MSIYIYILVMAVTTYLIRALPLLFMKKPIETVKKLAVEKIRLVGANGKA